MVAWCCAVFEFTGGDCLGLIWMFGFVCYCVVVNSVGAVADCLCLVFTYVFVVGIWIGVALRLTFVALCLVMLLRLLYVVV